MTPGPVSDSYDPEFGTAANAADIHEAIGAIVDHLSQYLGERKDILAVVNGKPGRVRELTWSERELRIIRFALERAMESL